jgi:serine/threonine protein kinase
VDSSRAASQNQTVVLPDSGSTPTAAVAGATGFLQHRVGDLIKNRYEILDHLGGGNFGSVYKVRDSAVGNILACKEMHVLDDVQTAFDERGAALELFKREALNLATLRHPNIPSAYFEQEDGDWHICPRCGLDFPIGSTPDTAICPEHGATLLPVQQRYYLMMDFVDGPTLEELAAANVRPLPEKRCLEWIGQIGSALQSLHRVGIVHRDVKPDNIKIRASDKTAILLDFGLTKKVEEAGSYGTISISGTTRFGTLGYAPENPRERENPERRSDIYALGMTLYRLLSGRDPQEPAQLKELRDFSPRYFNKSISPATERLIAVAVAPEVAWRYQSIDDFLADLKAIQEPNDEIFGAPALTYADGSRARNASDLARLIERYPDESAQYLFSGTLGTWLQQNGLAAAAQAAQSAIESYKEQPHRALEIFRRALYPSGASGVLPVLNVLPKKLDFGALASGATATLQIRIRNGGPGLLWGLIEIENVLMADSHTGSPPLPGLGVPSSFEGNDSILDVTLDTRKVAVGEYTGVLVILTDSAAQNGSGFQTRRIAVTYKIEPLQLLVEPEALDFGVIPVGARAVQTLRVRQKKLSAHGGQPRGTLYAGASLQGVLAPERFEGGEPFEITVDAAAPNVVAQSYAGVLQLDTNGGRFRIPISYRIALPPSRVLAVVFSTTLFAALVAGALRIGYALVDPRFAFAWLLTSELPPVSQSAGAILAGAIGGWFFSQSVARRLVSDVKNQREPGLRSVVRMFCALCGMPLGWLFAFVLHFVFWGLGDWMLWPIARAQNVLPTVSAPAAWAAVGALGGLIWGIARVGAAVGYSWSRYAASLLLGIIFLLLLLNAMLS